MRNIKSLKDVVDWGLCTGCGACAYACTEGKVKLVNISSVGIRPQFKANGCDGCTNCLTFCPGNVIEGNLAAPTLTQSESFDHELGPVLEVWQGHATDSEMRHRGSSGGVLSALATYCLEHEEMAFVLHTGVDENRPWLNKTVMSRTRGEILSRAGSRYAPASPGDSLAQIENSDRPCVFIGKPCDTAAVFKLRDQRPVLDRNLGLVLTFFCAGTPSTQGTLDLLHQFGVKRSSLTQLRYRGEGWPGRFTVTHDRGENSLSYDESWGKLSHYRPLRCQLCPDGVGRIADISCGDAWHDFNGTGDPGRSLVIVRTERGREILHRAMTAGYVRLTAATTSDVLAAQPNLLRKRRELFGRLAALRMFLVPVPSFRGFSLFRGWMQLPLSRKTRSLLGTIRRVITRGLWCRRSLKFMEP